MSAAVRGPGHVHPCGETGAPDSSPQAKRIRIDLMYSRSLPSFRVRSRDLAESDQFDALVAPLGPHGEEPQSWVCLDSAVSCAASRTMGAAPSFEMGATLCCSC